MHPGEPANFHLSRMPGHNAHLRRNGVQIEQCGNCRGIFLDFGELEHIGQMEANFVQHPRAQSYGPGWGKHGNRYRKRGFGSMFFSS